MSAARIAVVGAGPAAARFAHQLLSQVPAHAVELTLYGAERHPPYNRTLLAEALTGRYHNTALGLPYGTATEVRTGTEVTAIDPGARAIRLADGATVRYDHLVLATGAAPVLPALRGLRAGDGSLLGHVHPLRTLDDCQRLRDDARQATRAVVIGGGALGVGAARALADSGLATHIIDHAPRLMARHLDAEAARLVRRHLTALGVVTHLGTRPLALHGTDRVRAVELATGHRLETDLVVLACGVRPRTALARAAGLRVGRGIVIDDQLATSAPHIHAIGDCAEHRGVVHGQAGPAWEQADVLAARLSGTSPQAHYPGTRPLLRLTAGSLQLAAFGPPDAHRTDVHDVLHLADATRGTCKRLVLHGDRLVSAVLLGDLGTVGDLIRIWRRDEPLPADPSPLLNPEGAHP